jgi:NADP-dependent 3-hydroxy acid dehydrogenase YdfG
LIQPDRSIVITGAGSGFGEALAHRYARAGYSVAVTDIDSARADAVLADVRAAGGSGFSLGLDVNSPPGWDGLYQRVMDEWGRLDILVNNAGVAAAGRLEDTSLEDWHWILETDLVSVVRGCHRFLPRMREQGTGHLVNVASFAGLTPVPEVSAYATAKAAVVALSEQLRVDLAGSGVGVTVVCPAYVQTRLLETFRSSDERHRSMVERWMARSTVSAAQVAERVYHAVEKQEFLVLTHRETRWLWRYRRWFPGWYYRMMVRIAARMKARVG